MHLHITEKGNTWTHLIGVVFALSSIWMVWPAKDISWQMAMGVTFFIVGMFLMFMASTVYHWLPEGMAKRILRKCDHISIYVMIACSYTPICVGAIGGVVGWSVFALLWVIALVGTVGKIVALGKYPKLSLGIYLAMGWSGLIMAKPVLENLSWPAIACIVVEGLLYTLGTYFYANDHKKNFHAIWHVFVLLGAMAHWSVVLFILLEA